MQTDNLYTKEQAREKIIAGIAKASNAVGITMGTAGSNSILEALESPGFMNTNDGLTILRAMKFADPLEALGLKILLEAVEKANKVNGDGSSTTAVLTHAIISEGLKYITEASPMEIKRSLEVCVPIIEESIKKQKREITLDTVGAVATISSEDEKIGKTIQEIYQQIGKDGLIYWDVSKTGEDYYSIGNGIKIDGAGFVSPYMCDMDEKTGQFLNVARWKNPKVLITKQKITSAAEFNDLFQTLNSQDIKEVVVFCDEIEATAIGDFNTTRRIRGFKTLVVKMPVLWKDEWYEDLALASGATIIDPIVGLSLKNASSSHLGTFSNILVSKEDTFIDGIKDLTVHIANLQAGDDAQKVRAARLNTKTARYFVGAQSDSALSYRRLKVEDAIAASWQALNGGIVAGGGVALMNVTASLPDTIGGKILKVALQSPMKQIMDNAGILLGDTYQSLVEIEKGYDTRTKKLVNMFEAQIVDPANVVLNAAKNAISVAATALTAGTVVLLPKEEQLQITPQMLMR